MPGPAFETTTAFVINLAKLVNQIVGQKDLQRQVNTTDKGEDLARIWLEALFSARQFSHLADPE